MNRKTLVLFLIIVIAAFTRLIPHPMNFAPLGAMALFGSAYFGRKGLGLFLTMGAWFLSDLVLNNFVYASSSFTLFTEGAVYIYGSIVLIYLLGTQILKQVDLGRTIGGSLVATGVFFVLTNLGVWMGSGIYPLTFDGLVACYAAAIPFLKNTMLGDLFYAAVLFLTYEKMFRAQLTTEKAP